MVETHNSIIDMKIQDIPKVERPREKLIQYGSGRLSNSELLALLLRSSKIAGLYLKPEDIWKELKGQNYF